MHQIRKNIRILPMKVEYHYVKIRTTNTKQKYNLLILSVL